MRFVLSRTRSFKQRSRARRPDESAEKRVGGLDVLMFQSAYQDGDSVDVFSPAGKNPTMDWKLTGKVGRLYDKNIKG